MQSMTLIGGTIVCWGGRPNPPHVIMLFNTSRLVLMILSQGPLLVVLLCLPNVRAAQAGRCFKKVDGRRIGSRDHPTVLWRHANFHPKSMQIPGIGVKNKHPERSCGCWKPLSWWNRRETSSNNHASGTCYSLRTYECLFIVLNLKVIDHVLETWCRSCQTT